VRRHPPQPERDVFGRLHRGEVPVKLEEDVLRELFGG